MIPVFSRFFFDLSTNALARTYTQVCFSHYLTQLGTDSCQFCRGMGTLVGTSTLLSKQPAGWVCSCSPQISLLRSLAPYDVGESRFLPRTRAKQVCTHLWMV